MAEVVEEVGFGEPLVPKSSSKYLVEKSESLLETLSSNKKRSASQKKFKALKALSILYLELGELEQCEKRLRKSLNFAGKLYGENSFEFRTQLNFLGVLYFKQDQKRRATDTFQELIKSLEKDIGAEFKEDLTRADTAMIELLHVSRRNYAGVLLALGKKNEANAMLDKLPANKFASSWGQATLARSVKSVAADAAAVGAATSGTNKNRVSLRKRLSQMLVGKGKMNPNLDFMYELPLGESTPLLGSSGKDAGPESPHEAEVRNLSIVDLLDHIASILSDARRSDHTELLFRTALAGSYGSLSKLEEQRIAVRLAMMLGDIPEYIDEATAILQRALVATEELYGRSDIQTGVICGDLATFHAKKGDYESAEKLYKRALKIFRSLDFPHPKEDKVYSNLTTLMKVKQHTKSSSKQGAAQLARMSLAIDDEWIFQQSNSSVSPEAIGATVKVAVLMEKAEKGSPTWYNWRDDDRKKALLAYALEVFRDHADMWEEGLAPKYLLIICEVERLLGKSYAVVPISANVLKPRQNRLVQQPSPQQQAEPKKQQQSKRSSLIDTLLGRKPSPAASSSSPTDDTSATEQSKKTRQRRRSSKKGEISKGKFLNRDIDPEKVLVSFFSEYSPKKANKEYVSRMLDKYKDYELGLFEALELRYNVLFKPDGSFYDAQKGEDGLTRSNSVSSEQENQLAPGDSDESGTLDPNVSLRETISNFYAEFAPERMGAVDAMLQHFQGRHKALFLAFEEKYGVKFQRDGKAIKIDPEHSKKNQILEEMNADRKYGSNGSTESGTVHDQMKA